MANVKVTQDKNGVRWLELMRNGSGTLLEIRDNDEALQIISALQQSVQPTKAIRCACGGEMLANYRCQNCGLASPL